MRIDPNNSIAQQSAAGRTEKASDKRPSSSSLSEDQATFSHSAVTLASLAQRALAPSATREARVSALRDAVANGHYKLDPDAMAEAMLAEGSE